MTEHEPDCLLVREPNLDRCTCEVPPSAASGVSAQWIRIGEANNHVGIDYDRWTNGLRTFDVPAGVEAALRAEWDVERTRLRTALEDIVKAMPEYAREEDGPNVALKIARRALAGEEALNECLCHYNPATGLRLDIVCPIHDGSGGVIQ